MILDYEFFRDVAPADHQLLFGSLLRVWQATGRHVGAVVTDRGFATADNSRALKEGGTFDGLCPRKPAELRRRRAAWRPRKPYALEGVLAKYAALVGSASGGAVTSPRATAQA